MLQFHIKIVVLVHFTGDIMTKNPLLALVIDLQSHIISPGLFLHYKDMLLSAQSIWLYW